MRNCLKVCCQWIEPTQRNKSSRCMNVTGGRLSGPCFQKRRARRSTMASSITRRLSIQTLTRCGSRGRRTQTVKHGSYAYSRNSNTPCLKPSKLTSLKKIAQKRGSKWKTECGKLQKVGEIDCDSLSALAHFDWNLKLLRIANEDDIHRAIGDRSANSHQEFSAVTNRHTIKLDYDVAGLNSSQSRGTAGAENTKLHTGNVLACNRHNL